MVQKEEKWGGEWGCLGLSIPAGMFQVPLDEDQEDSAQCNWRVLIGPQLFIKIHFKRESLLGRVTGMASWRELKKKKNSLNQLENVTGVHGVIIQHLLSAAC